jgi:glycosyltransferase involved in cell wall biosynthesis
MKILHITPAYIPAYRYGGPIRVVHELNKWLVKLGAEVTVYTTNVDGPGVLNVVLGREILMDGVKVVFFPISFPRGWFNSAEMNKAMKANIKDFDLVHITSTFLAASYFGSKYAREARVPYVISPRGNFMKDTYHKKYLKKRIYTELIEKKALKSAAAIHFTAEAEKEEYIKEGLPLNRAIVSPNGVDDDSFGQIPERGAFRRKFGFRKEKLVLFLGRISWKKGFDTLVPAMVQVSKEIADALLVVAGGDDEGYQKEVENMAKEHGILNKLRFLGMLLGGDKNSALQDADIFVLPSYSENFGNAVVEAMYFGLPVILTPGVAIAEEIAEAGAGMVVPKDYIKLAEAMKLTLLNTEIRQNMAENGKKLVKMRFFWPEIAKNLLLAYKSILK